MACTYCSASKKVKEGGAVLVIKVPMKLAYNLQIFQPKGSKPSGIKNLSNTAAWPIGSQEVGINTIEPTYFSLTTRNINLSFTNRSVRKF
jgi:hypothetical protein